MSDPVPARRETRRLLAVASLAAAFVAVPLMLLAAFAGVELPWSAPSAAKAPPQWLALPALRATAGDGTVVRTRIALDVADAGARRLIERNTQQVVLLLEGSVAGRDRDELASEAGVRRLGADLRDRLNGYLADAGVGPARQVLVQDLLIGRP